MCNVMQHTWRKCYEILQVGCNEGMIGVLRRDRLNGDESRVACEK